MNQETIENLITNLSKLDFDKVIHFLLPKVFYMQAIDVDGKGDGGSDYRVFSDSNNNKIIAIQKTVQDVNWRNKALEDARKAKQQLRAQRYFFLTSRSRESKSLRELENDISSELLIPATCLGATEIAGLIIDNKLLGEFSYALNLQMGINDFIYRPDNREILLHSYFSLSDDRNELQHKIYESTILSLLYRKLIHIYTRESIVKKVIEFLDLDIYKERAIYGRIDALLGQGKLIKSKDSDELILSKDTRQELTIIDGIYQKEMSQISTKYSDLLLQYNGNWNTKFSEEMSVLLAKLCVEKQIKNIKNALLAFSLVGLGQDNGNTEIEIKNFIKDSGVPKNKCDIVYQELVNIAVEDSLVKKIVNSVVYVALEVSVANKASTILGKANWSQIKIILDASVAIPYLTSNLFAPAKGRFSVGSLSSVNLFKKKGCKLRIPLVYLNECASHLVGALNYCQHMDEFEDTLQYSENGYVSHYYQLKLAGQEVPNTLIEYLTEIAPTITRETKDKYSKIRNVMADLQPVFTEYGVCFEDVPKIPPAFMQELEQEYSYALCKLSRGKARNLINHDVTILAHLRRDYSEQLNQSICLTWDAVMMAVGRSMQNIGWVVSPVEACDLFQARLGISKEKLMTLAHHVAGVMNRPYEIGAKILDRAATLASEKFYDWQFRKKIEELRQQALSRIQLSSNEFNLEEFNRETDKFLSELGVNIPNEGDQTEEYLKDINS